jgi:hypothetical protein
VSSFNPEIYCDECDQLIRGGICRLPNDSITSLCRGCHKAALTSKPSLKEEPTPMFAAPNPESVAPPLLPPSEPRKRGVCAWPECGMAIKWGLCCSRDSGRFHSVMGRYPNVGTPIAEIESAAKLWDAHQVEVAKARAERAEARTEIEAKTPPSLRLCAWPGCDRQISIGVCCHRDCSRFKTITGHRPSVDKPEEVGKAAAIWESRNKSQRQPDQKEPKQEEVTVSQDQKVFDLQNELKDVRTKWCDAVVQLAAVDTALGSDRSLGHNERLSLISKRTQKQPALTVADLRRRVERLHQWEILSEVFKTGGSLQIISAETGRCFELQAEDAPELHTMLARLEREALS